MASPQDFLPGALPNDAITALLTSISLPRPTSIQPFQVTAAFHSIYLITFSPNDASALSPATARNPDGTTTLVLRVSGDHIPRKKTLNEVAIMRWVSANTSVPVPAVVRFDASTDNLVGREFTLLERAPGRSVDKMYAALPGEAKQRLVEQLTCFVLDLNRHHWDHVGGLQLMDDESVLPGPVLEDTFWLAPDVVRYWGPDESADNLNPTGPYTSHAGLVAGYLACFIYAIRTHPSLAWLRDLTPRLEALKGRLSSIAALSSTRLVLAHKDLHFANVMATEDGTVTAVLDWEFAGVVPALRWDPVRAFLWSGEDSQAAVAEKGKMQKLFEEELRRRGEERWWEKGVGQEVHQVWTVVKFVRALVEVCPRGQRAEKVEGWRKTAEHALSKLKA